MKKLLLHSCCAPCSTTAIMRLIDEYDITIFYYNPNIEPLSEYEHRKSEQIRLIKELDRNIKFIDGDYDNDAYQEYITDYKELGEHSMRCYKCMEMRIDKTGKYASSNGFDCFTTTLSVSPYKNSTWINEILEKVSIKYNIPYVKSNFKKKNGYLESVEMSKKYNLYRQNYCGCLKNKQ